MSKELSYTTYYHQSKQIWAQFTVKSSYLTVFPNTLYLYTNVEIDLSFNINRIIVVGFLKMMRHYAAI